MALIDMFKRLTGGKPKQPSSPKTEKMDSRGGVGSGLVDDPDLIATAVADTVKHAAVSQGKRHNDVDVKFTIQGQEYEVNVKNIFDPDGKVSADIKTEDEGK
ncbi:MAG: hypothetical protein CMF39_00225 [Legionellaceae bacterium]|nr:hypothetical protein [Legionellaceae bacterium]